MTPTPMAQTLPDHTLRSSLIPIFIQLDIRSCTIAPLAAMIRPLTVRGWW